MFYASGSFAYLSSPDLLLPDDPSIQSLLFVKLFREMVWFWDRFVERAGRWKWTCKAALQRLETYAQIKSRLLRLLSDNLDWFNALPPCYLYPWLIHLKLECIVHSIKYGNGVTGDDVLNLYRAQIQQCMRQTHFVEDVGVKVDMVHLYSVTMLAAKDDEKRLKADKGQVANIRAAVIARQVLAHNLVVEEQRAQIKADAAVRDLKAEEIEGLANQWGQDRETLSKMAYSMAKLPGKLRAEYKRLTERLVKDPKQLGVLEERLREKARKKSGAIMMEEIAVQHGPDASSDEMHAIGV